MLLKMAKHEQLPYIEFLDSETVSLQADQTGRSFQIHRRLLASKAKTIISAFERGFDEGEKGVYKFQDTSDGTLARFIEWAYTDNYPDVITATHPVDRKSGKEDTATTNAEEGDTLSAAGTIFTPDNHPLLAHIRLYIFCSIYLIPDLQKLAFEKVTARFADLKEPDSLDRQLAVIAALRVSFRKLSTQDPLLDWQAQYAAYCVGKLRLQRGFYELLRESPTLSTRMVLFLNPASSPPWKTTHSEHVYARYSPDQSYEDGYE
jgi:hypothetical protein